MIFANYKHNDARIDANDYSDRSLDVYCPDCMDGLTFVNANLKAKHFRHQTNSECAGEPESDVHIAIKRELHARLQATGLGIATLEKSLIGIRPDVLWEHLFCRIGFEVQATSVNIEVYERKIERCENKRMPLVYIFVRQEDGGDFLRQTKNNIYSLKEIERRLIVDKSPFELPIAGYWQDGNIWFPKFKEKYRRGGGGFCSNRFIVDRYQSRLIEIEELAGLIKAATPEHYGDKCAHGGGVIYRPSYGAIHRYGAYCNECDRHVKWIPNRDIERLGLKPL